MKVAVLCDFPFWEGRVGSAVRMESLCQSLAKACDLSVICSLELPSKFQTQISQAPYSFYDLDALEVTQEASPNGHLGAIPPDRQIIVKAISNLVEKSGFDAVLTPYFNRSWMTEHLHRDVLRIVDTNDCQSQRTRSFAVHGMIPTFPMTAADEAAELAKYDIALALSDDDQLEFSQITKTPIITAPFRLPAKPIYSTRENASDVLFIAAKSEVNDLTLAYLAEEVLPLVRRSLTLHVVGNVSIPESLPPLTKLVHHQDVEDLAWIYRSVDLALNPTYAGGGIKTKTLEAMAYGVPVLTSDEGARGLSELLPTELVINDKETFAFQIGELLDNPKQRASLSKHIIENLRAEDNENWLKPFVQILQTLRAHKQEAKSA